MNDPDIKNLKIRPLKAGDFDALVALDGKLVRGKNRQQYWEKKFAIFRVRHPNLSLVATMGDDIVGYIMGNVSGWEFGVSAGIGWVELLGVDPEYQRKGVAKEMTNELLNQFKALNVKTIYTMMNADYKQMRSFFRSLGFREGEMIHLEKDLD